MPLLVLALAGDARTDHLGEPVVVGGRYAPALLYAGAQRVAARLGTEQAEAQGKAVAHSGLLDRFAQVQRIRRRADEHGGAEVLHELDLARGVAGGVRPDERADALQPVVQAKAAGEHAVAEGHLGDVARHDPGGRRQPRHQLGPGV